MPLSVRSGIDQGDLALSLARIVRDEQSCGVLVFNHDQRLISCTPNASRLLGCDTAPLLGTTADALPARLRELVRKTADTGHARSDTEFVPRPDTPDRGLRLTALPLQGAGADGLTAILVQDLSLVGRLEEDIRQLDRLASVGTLAAEMAHEVKNALVAVKTFVDLLLEKNPGNELEETVRREMKRIEAIVSQVLNYSRTPADTRQKASIHALLERTVRVLQPQLDGRHITLVTRLTAAPDTVHGDDSQLEQAVLNLLLNALDAMGREGTLTVETDLVTGPGKDSTQHVASRQLRIVIRDTGAGISTDHMSRLFEPFFTTKKHGTGLGLAITRRIIHEHHGLIRAESQPGQGAAFTITLPAA